MSEICTHISDKRGLASGVKYIIPLRLTADGKPSRFTLPIFGGEHGDLPLNEQAGKLIGETVAGMAESCIVSLGSLATKEGERRFMLAFLESLYRNASNNPVHVIFDEADMWAPQQTGKGAGPQLQALMEQIVRRGRVRGFIPWLITQRPASISKDVLSQIDGLIAFKMTSSQDRKAIGDWVKGQADEGEWNRIWAGMPTMQRGEGVVWVPARGVLETVKFPAKATFDSSRTPKRGERKLTAELKPLDLDQLKDRLASIEEDTKANDPRALKAEVARLTRELAKAAKAPAPAPVQQPKVESEVLSAAETHGFVRGFEAGKAAAMAAIKGLPLPGGTITLQPAATRAPRPTKAMPEIIADGSVPASCAKPLAALAAVYPSGLTEAQWATAAGYKRSGGTWGTYKSRLRGAALIEQREGRWFATEQGASAVGDVELPPSPGPDLVRWWATKLPGTAKVAEALIEAWPRALSKDELAARIGMTPSGGSFGTYLSRLAGPGLIDRDGGVVRLTEEVMGG